MKNRTMFWGSAVVIGCVCGIMIASFAQEAMTPAERNREMAIQWARTNTTKLIDKIFEPGMTIAKLKTALKTQAERMRKRDAVSQLDQLDDAALLSPTMKAELEIMRAESVEPVE